MTELSDADRAPPSGDPTAVLEPLTGVERHVSRRIPVVPPGTAVRDVRQLVAASPFDSVSAVAVVDRGRLVGLAGIAQVLTAPDDATVDAVMDTDPPRIAPGVNHEAVAWLAVQHGEDTLAVEDGAGMFIGLVPPHELLRLMLAEHDEDMARFGGLLAGASMARLAAEEPVERRLWHRLPWLLVGLAGAIAAAQLVGAFEEQLRETVVIAFFIPGVVYMGDALGTQTETLVVRGLSVGIPIRRVVRREVVTGIVMGALVAAIFLPLGALLWGVQVATAVALALFASCAVATGVAMTLPWLFVRFGFDPAFGSGPLSTVIQDLLSMVIYLAITVALLS